MICPWCVGSDRGDIGGIESKVAVNKNTAIIVYMYADDNKIIKIKRLRFFFFGIMFPLVATCNYVYYACILGRINSRI